ncbi:Chromosomal replication initiator protein DnaA [subsurface metagenome]
MAINIEDLTEETMEKLGIRLPPPINQVADSLIALGRVFRALKDLPDEEALQVLQQAQLYILKRSIPEIEEEKPGSYAPPVGWTIQVVARSFRLTPADLKQRNREVGVVQARQVAMYVLSMTDKYTLKQIGQALGGRSPATVSHGFQRVAGQLTNDEHLRGKVSEICTILTGRQVNVKRA